MKDYFDKRNIVNYKLVHYMKRKLQYHNINQSDLTRLSGLSRYTINKLCNGYLNLNVNKLLPLLKVFNTKPSTFFTNIGM